MPGPASWWHLLMGKVYRLEMPRSRGQFGSQFGSEIFVMIICPA